MTRQIICRACYEKRGPMHPEDVLAGWNQRFVHGHAKKPAGHEIKIYTGGSLDKLKLDKTIRPASLVCDHCNEQLPDGTGSVAITMWRPARESEPDDWEKKYLA